MDSDLIDKLLKTFVLAFLLFTAAIVGLMVFINWLWERITEGLTRCPICGMRGARVVGRCEALSMRTFPGVNPEAYLLRDISGKKIYPDVYQNREAPSPTYTITEYECVHCGQSWEDDPEREFREERDRLIHPSCPICGKPGDFRGYQYVCGNCGHRWD